MTHRVALITGGAGGIGCAIAMRFVGLGDTVVLADLSRESLKDAAGGISSVDTLIVDVTSVADCEAMVATTLARHGRLDVLVNAAGVWVEGPTAAMTEAEWDRTIDVNLKGTFFACRYALPHLERTQGCIVNISSDAGLGGNPGCAIYNASKFGVNGITKSLGLELAPLGVRVNAVCPADVDTPMLADQARVYGRGEEKRYLDELLAKYPAGPNARFIHPDEIAALVVFLASPEAAPITAACIPVEFGLTAGY